MRCGCQQVLLILRTLVIRNGHPSPKEDCPSPQEPSFPMTLIWRMWGDHVPEFPWIPQMLPTSHWCPPKMDRAETCLPPTHPISFLMLKEDQGRCPCPENPSPQLGLPPPGQNGSTLMIFPIPNTRIGWFEIPPAQ